MVTLDELVKREMLGEERYALSQEMDVVRHNLVETAIRVNKLKGVEQRAQTTWDYWYYDQLVETLQQEEGKYAALHKRMIELQEAIWGNKS